MGPYLVFSLFMKEGQTEYHLALLNKSCGLPPATTKNMLELLSLPSRVITLDIIVIILIVE